MTATDGSEFDRIASEYDRIRPAYPDALVDAALGRGALTAGSRVLEVGCGTGQLTFALVVRGLTVDAVDPGARMIEQAKLRVGDGATFHLGRFEDAELSEGAYEAVFSATAFHWIDPGVGWTKLARLLRAGGLVALLHHGIGAETSALADALTAAWHDAVPSRSEWRNRDPFTVWDGFEQRRENVSAAWSWLTRHDLTRPEAAVLFGDVDLLAAPTPREYGVEEYLALMRTTSSYLRLDETEREGLEVGVRDAFRREGGIARFADWTVLVTAFRR